MARGFGATYGSADTDRIESAVTSIPSTRSFSCMQYRAGFPASTVSMVLEKYDGGGSAVGDRFFAESGGLTELQVAFSGGWSNWTVSNPTASTWKQLGYSIDDSSVSNDPLVYIGGVSQTVTLASRSSGTAFTNSRTWRFGNDYALAKPFYGYMAEVALWSVILTADEWKALGAGVSPLLIRPTALIEYLPLIGAATSYVAAAPTVTGTVLQQHPQAIYGVSPHFLPAVGAAAATVKRQMLLGAG